MIGRNTLTSGVTSSGIGYNMELFNYSTLQQEKGGRHPHQGSGKDKVCLLQREDGDDEESLPVAGMEDSVFRGSCGTDVASDSCSAMGSSTKGSNTADEGQQSGINSAEGASKSEQYAAGKLLENFPR